jgi:hypothetical protein
MVRHPERMTRIQYLSDILIYKLEGNTEITLATWASIGGLQILKKRNVWMWHELSSISRTP